MKRGHNVLFSNPVYYQQFHLLHSFISSKKLFQMIITGFYTNWSNCIQLEKSWDAVKLTIREELRCREVGGGDHYWGGEGGGVLINGGLTPLQIMDGYKGSAIQADKAL